MRPAVLTATLLTFIGPWNEFLWPFLVTKEQSLQPLAVTLANYISNIAGRADNPYGAILAGAVVLAAPAVALFVDFPEALHRSELEQRCEGMTMKHRSVATRRVSSVHSLLDRRRTRARAAGWPWLCAGRRRVARPPPSARAG